MRVFVTGATGFIGSVIVRNLVESGHEVLGLARTEAAVASLAAVGAKAQRGELEDLESLRSAAAWSEGIIHTGFIHDFSRFKEVCEIDRRAIEGMGTSLVGSDRRLIVTSGTAVAVTPGRASNEDDNANSPMPRIASEEAADSVAARGVNVSVVRLPQVHDPFKQGFVTLLVGIARDKGVSAFVGDGLNRWPAVHVEDAARLYQLALEKGEAGVRYNAVAEEGVPTRDMAESIGRGLKIPVVSKSPEEAPDHFGWFSSFVGHDMPASSALTQERLGWKPTGPTMISDLDQARF